MVKILDCTLRDGGYYTNWDFEKGIVDEYVRAMDALPVECMEVGYRSPASKRYMGKYGYCPRFELEDLRRKSHKKISVMFNEKEVVPADLPALLDPVAGAVDMVRMAVAPANLQRGLRLGEAIKKRGVKVAFNVMYMSQWREMGGFLSGLRDLDGVADCINMVDSYGGVSPRQVRETVALLREKSAAPIGFHGHNNLEMALVNTLEAIECGVEWVDATVLGMGRGAGNLKTELLLTCLNKSEGLEVDFNALGNVVLAFTPLHRRYGWGTSLPYMISGANSLPQKDVMDWVSNRLHSFNSIVRALQNKKLHVEDNDKFPLYVAPASASVLVVGGGASTVQHIEALRELLAADRSMTVIHASSRNAALFKGLPNPQLFCLTGSEGQRLERVFRGLGDFQGRCILPPYPRKMGTEVPASVYGKTFELGRVEFTDQFCDSCTAMALQAALEMRARTVWVAGYDGYTDMMLTQKERDLTHENETIFEAFRRSFEGRLASLTPTLYNALEVESVYQKI